MESDAIPRSPSPLRRLRADGSFAALLADPDWHPTIHAFLVQDPVDQAGTKPGTNDTQMSVLS